MLYIDSARLSLGLYQHDVNVIWDLAPHDISIVSSCSTSCPSRRRCGRSATSGRGRRTSPTCGSTSRRTHAFVHVSWLNPNKVRRTTVVGERRMAVYDDMSDNERIRIYDIGVDPAEIDNPHLAHEMPVTYRTGDIISPFVPFREPLIVQDQHFVDCIRTGRPVRPPRASAASTSSGCWPRPTSRWPPGVPPRSRPARGRVVHEVAS